MSSPATLERPHLAEPPQGAEVDWIELDEITDATAVACGEPWHDSRDFVELEAPRLVVVYDSQEAMRHGPQSFTPHQAKFIEAAVRSRRPLSEPPLPLDD